MFSLFVRSPLCISTKSNFKQLRRFTDDALTRRPRFNRHSKPLTFEQPHEEPKKPVEEHVLELVKPFLPKDRESRELEIPKKELSEFTTFVEKGYLESADKLMDKWVATKLIFPLGSSATDPFHDYLRKKLESSPYSGFNNDIAADILDKFIKIKFFISASTFDILILVASVKGDYEMALKLYNTMKSKGIEPTAQLINKAVNVALKLERLDFLVTVLKDFEKTPFYLSSKIFKLLLTFLSKNNLTLFKYLLDNTQKVTKDIDLIPLRIALKTFYDLQDSENAVKYYELFKYLKPTIEDTRILIHCLCNNDNLQLATKYYIELVAQGINDDKCLVYLIRSARTKGIEEQYKKLLSVKYDNPILFAYEMQYLLDKGEYYAVYDLEENMKAMGIPVDNVCLELLLRASALNGDETKALHYWEELKKLSKTTKSSIKSYNQMVHLYSITKQEKKMENILNEIKEAGISFDSITYMYALLAYQANGKVNKMRDLLIDMQNNHVPMDIMIIRIYLRTFVGLGAGTLTDMALELLTYLDKYDELERVPFEAMKYFQKFLLRSREYN